MQIAPVLSVMMPYVARPADSPAAIATGSAAASSGHAQPAGVPSHALSTAVSPVTSSDSATQVTRASNPAGNEASTATDMPAPHAQATASEQGHRGGDATQQESTQPGSADRASTNDPASAVLTERETQDLKELKSRDREVRQHELAHQAVGGQHAGGTSYTFERGPDGGRYAVAGEVPVDVSAVPGDPQATLEKMRQVRAAALAPAEPSAQDRQVAAKASQAMMAAQLEIAVQRREATDTQAGTPAGAGDSAPGDSPASSRKAAQAYTTMAEPAAQSLAPNSTRVTA